MGFTQPMNRIKALPALSKAGLVLAGYFAAMLMSCLAVAVYAILTSGADRDTYGAMFAFGDLFLFAAVFGAVSIFPTGLALYFLRQSRGFWIAAALVGLLVASTSLAEVVVTVLASGKAAVISSQSVWAMLAFPRIFLTPFFAAAFGLAALFAPEPRFRWFLLAAAAIEGISSVYGFFHWFAPMYVDGARTQLRLIEQAWELWSSKK
jgi:hypothetical protein